MGRPVPPRRWLADEMLGRLARYLRILGEDTEYVRGMSDGEIVAAATAGGRRVITRDRELATRSAGSVLLHAAELGAQLRELRAAEPSLPTEPAFDRCTRCNGTLEAAGTAAAGGSAPPGVVRFRCAACGQHYWEGSHTRRIRADLQLWFGVAAP